MSQPEPAAPAASPGSATSQGWLRRVAASVWSPVVVGLPILGAHAVWFARSERALLAEPVSGFGTVLALLGLWLAAQSLILTGLREAAKNATPRGYRGSFYITAESRREAREHFERRVDANVPGLRRERVVAALLIATGSLIGGYSGPISRALARMFFGLT